MWRKTETPLPGLILKVNLYNSVQQRPLAPSLILWNYWIHNHNIKSPWFTCLTAQFNTCSWQPPFIFKWYCGEVTSFEDLTTCFLKRLIMFCIILIIFSISNNMLEGILKKKSVPFFFISWGPKIPLLKIFTKKKNSNKIKQKHSMTYMSLGITYTKE